MGMCIFGGIDHVQSFQFVTSLRGQRFMYGDRAAAVCVLETVVETKETVIEIS